MNHPHALPPELQRLLNEPLSEPPATARQHWKALDKAMDSLDQARARQSEYGAEVVRLRAELEQAKQRDQQALGEALAAERPEPEPEAAAIEAEVERNAKREAAMTGQILEAQRRVTELVLRSKASWTSDVERQLGDAAAGYRTAIVAIEQARERLVAELHVAAWLTRFPESVGQPQTAFVPALPVELVEGAGHRRATWLRRGSPGQHDARLARRRGLR
jgi:hypothetical protein